MAVIGIEEGSMVGLGWPPKKIGAEWYVGPCKNHLAAISRGDPRKSKVLLTTIHIITLAIQLDGIHIHYFGKSWLSFSSPIPVFLQIRRPLDLHPRQPRLQFLQTLPRIRHHLPMNCQDQKLPIPKFRT